MKLAISIDLRTAFGGAARPTFVGLAIVVLACGVARADELALADLVALDRQGSWAELLDKADQVRPSNRNADWTRLVGAAAGHVMDDLAKADSDGRTVRRLAELVPIAEHKYGFLLADAHYLDGKARALARIVHGCAQDQLDCGTFVETLAAGVQHFPRGVAKQIALMLADEQTPSRALRFWALAADDDRAVCGDGRLARAVVGALRGDRAVADAQRAAATCYDALEPALVKELVASDETAKPPFLRNACPVLKTHGAQTVAKKKKCP